MSDDESNNAGAGESTNANDLPGLTKPLVNNVGGMIDQDAPSADQLLKGQSDPSWDNTQLQEGDRGVHREDTSGLVPEFGEGIGTPGNDY